MLRRDRPYQHCEATNLLPSEFFGCRSLGRVTTAVCDNGYNFCAVASATRHRSGLLMHRKPLTMDKRNLNLTTGQ